MIIKTITICFSFVPVPDAAPSNLKVMAIKASEVFLEWTPIPKANVHGILKGYELKYKKYFDTVYDVEYTEGEISEKSISRLKGFTLYMFEVSAYTTTGKGPPAVEVIKTLEGGLLHFSLWINRQKI